MKVTQLNRRGHLLHGVFRKRAAAILLICALLLAGCDKGRPANTVSSPEDAEGKVIGVLYGSSSVRFAGELGQVRTYTLASAMTDDLKNGSIDCILMEKAPADALTSKISGITKLQEPLLEYDLRFAIAKENADLTKDINTALAALAETGVLKGISDKYIMGGNYTYITPENPDSLQGTLTLAVPGDNPPYSYKNGDGGLSGMDIAVARAVCDVLGVDLALLEVAAEDLVVTVQFGKADFALGGIYENDLDAERVDFSEPYTHFVQLLIVRK